MRENGRHREVTFKPFKQTQVKNSKCKCGAQIPCGMCRAGWCVCLQKSDGSISCPRCGDLKVAGTPKPHTQDLGSATEKLATEILGKEWQILDDFFRAYIADSGIHPGDLKIGDLELVCTRTYDSVVRSEYKFHIRDKNEIAQEIANAEERGRQEIIVELERTLESTIGTEFVSLAIAGVLRKIYSKFPSTSPLGDGE